MSEPTLEDLRSKYEKETGKQPYRYIVKEAGGEQTTSGFTTDYIHWLEGTVAKERLAGWEQAREACRKRAFDAHVGWATMMEGADGDDFAAYDFSSRACLSLAEDIAALKPEPAEPEDEPA